MFVGVGDGELRASGEAGAEREKKEGDSENEGFEGRARKDGLVKCNARRKIGPVIGERESIETGIGRRRGHKKVERSGR